MVDIQPPPFVFDFKRSLPEILGINLEYKNPRSSKRFSTRRSAVHQENEEDEPLAPPFLFDFKRNLLEILEIEIEEEIENLTEDLEQSYKEIIDRSIAQAELEIQEEEQRERSSAQEEVEEAPLLNDTITYEQFGSQQFCASTPHVLVPRKRKSTDITTTPVIKRLCPVLESPAYESMEVDPTLSHASVGLSQMNQLRLDATVYMEVDEAEKTRTPAPVAQPRPVEVEHIAAKEEAKISLIEDFDVTLLSDSALTATPGQSASSEKRPADCRSILMTSQRPEDVPEDPIERTKKTGTYGFDDSEISVISTPKDSKSMVAEASPVRVEPAEPLLADEVATDAAEITLVDDSDVTIQSNSELTLTVPKSQPSEKPKDVQSPVDTKPKTGTYGYNDSDMSGLSTSNSRGPTGTFGFYDSDSSFKNVVTAEKSLETKLDISLPPVATCGVLPKPVEHPFGPRKTVYSFKSPGRNLKTPEVDIVNDSIVSSDSDDDDDSAAVYGDVSDVSNATLIVKRRSKPENPRILHMDFDESSDEEVEQKEEAEEVEMKDEEERRDLEKENLKRQSMYDTRTPRSRRSGVVSDITIQGFANVESVVAKEPKREIKDQKSVSMSTRRSIRLSRKNLDVTTENVQADIPVQVQPDSVMEDNSTVMTKANDSEDMSVVTDDGDQKRLTMFDVGALNVSGVVPNQSQNVITENKPDFKMEQPQISSVRLVQPDDAKKEESMVLEPKDVVVDDIEQENGDPKRLTMFDDEALNASCAVPKQNQDDTTENAPVREIELPQISPVQAQAADMDISMIKSNRKPKDMSSVCLDLSELRSSNDRSCIDSTMMRTSALSISLVQSSSAIAKSKNKLKNGWLSHSKKAKALKEQSMLVEVPEVPKALPTPPPPAVVVAEAAPELPEQKNADDDVFVKPSLTKRLVNKRKSMAVSRHLSATSMFSTGSPIPPKPKKKRSDEKPVPSTSKKSSIFDLRTPKSRRSGAVVQDVTNQEEGPQKRPKQSIYDLRTPNSRQEGVVPTADRKRKYTDGSKSLLYRDEELENVEVNIPRSTRSRVPVLPGNAAERIEYEYDENGFVITNKVASSSRANETARSYAINTRSARSTATDRRRL